MTGLKGHRVYLDASAVIYAVEGTPAFANLKMGLLRPLLAAQDFSALFWREEVTG
jgi:hypothetical protein